jgi:hypothetical protein
MVAPDFPPARERRRTAGSFADADELAQDEDHARDQGGLGVEQIVDVVGDSFGSTPPISKKPTNGSTIILVRSSSTSLLQVAGASAIALQKPRAHARTASWLGF